MNIIQPKGFITNQTPVFEWETIDGAANYNFTLTNNVTGSTVIEQVVVGTSYTPTEPLAYGTYQIEIKTGNKIAIEIIVITSVTATYTVTGRDGDTKYLTYKSMQQNVRQQVKQSRYNAEAILRADEAIQAYLAECGDADLVAYHQNTILQTPGLGADLLLARQLATQLVEVVSRIYKRDPQF